MGKFMASKIQPYKNEVMLISRKANTLAHPPIIMLNQQIQDVQFHKHLGVYFSSDCSWHQHIDYIKRKAWTRLNIMRKLKFDLDRKYLETIYIYPLFARFWNMLISYGTIVHSKKNKILKKYKQKRQELQLGRLN